MGFYTKLGKVIPACTLVVSENLSGFNLGIGSRKDSLKPTLNHKKNENIISNKIHTANIQIGKREITQHTSLIPQFCLSASKTSE